MPYDTVTPIAIEGGRILLLFTGPDVKELSDDTHGVPDIRAYARAKLSELNQRETKQTGLQLKVPLDLTPPAVVPLTPEQTWERDAAIAERDANRLQLLSGIVKPEDPDIAAHKEAAIQSRAAFLSAKV